MMQQEFFEWLFPYNLGVLVLTSLPAFLIWGLGQYIEAIIYNSHRPDTKVPRNQMQTYFIELYQNKTKHVSVALVVLYCLSYSLLSICGYLLANILGLVGGMIFGLIFFLHMRQGVTLEKRIQRKREFDEKLERGELKLFG